MSPPLLSVSRIQSLQGLCDILQRQPEVRFAGIINQMGNLIAGGFKKGVKPYAPYSRQHMMYMQLVLEIKMRREFDDILGSVKYMHSKREKVSMLSIPKGEFVVVISLQEHPDIEKIVKLVEEHFKEEQTIEN